MTRSLGTSLGVAATGAVLAVRLAAHAGTHVESTVSLGPAVLTPAFRESALFLALIAVIAAAISLARGPRAQTVPQAAARSAASQEDDRERQIAGAEAFGV
jgi:hypothetical protein